MTKITFENLPSTNTPLNASNMNTLQTNVENAITTVEGEVTTLSNNFDELVTYNTEEQRIGTWIDGKPIYRMILTGTRSSGTLFYVSFNVSCEQIIKVDAYAQTSTQAWGLYRVNDTDQFRYFIDRISPLKLTFLNGSSNPTAPFTYKVIVEYTKTTDTVS